MKDSEMGEACNRHGRDYNCVMSFGGKTWCDEFPFKNHTEMAAEHICPYVRHK